MSERNYIERQAAEARKKAIQGAAADALDEIRTTVLKLLMLTGIEDDTATVRRAMDHAEDMVNDLTGDALDELSDEIDAANDAIDRDERPARWAVL